MADYPRNYMHVKRFGIWYTHYTYIDVPEYLADQLFATKGVRIKFKEEMAHPNYPYIFVFCKVHKEDEHKFLDCLSLLHDKMLICGHSDYPDFCKSIISRVESAGRSTRAHKAR